VKKICKTKKIEEGWGFERVSGWIFGLVECVWCQKMRNFKGYRSVLLWLWLDQY
jgi:hypothetical protein